MIVKKACYPWRLGATSCVLPGDIQANVNSLASLVDDIQLLFFESEGKSLLPNPLDLSALAEIFAEYELTCTVHLPTDLSLGSSSVVRRHEGVSEIVRLIGRLSPLKPEAFDLHLNQEPGLPEAVWLDNLALSLGELSLALGDERKKVAVENIAYPFDLVAPAVSESGFGVCLDIGHLVCYDHDLEQGLALLPQAAHLHYHGVRDGRDHQALGDERQARLLGERLFEAGYAGVLTLEMYSLEKLTASLAFLDRIWSGYRRGAE